MVAKRRGPYAAGSGAGKLARNVGCSVRFKENVVDFLRIGGQYHGVGFLTYVQWLVEQALLEEIRYYGWAEMRPVQFERQKSWSEREQREFLHLNQIAQRRARETAIKVDPDGAPKT